MGMDDALYRTYQSVLFSDGRVMTSLERQEQLEVLRRLVFVEGLPDCASDENSFGRCTLRGTLWKIFLGVGKVTVEKYVELVERGPSVDYDKICNDVYRTFVQHTEYTSRVPRERLVRLLNAHVHQLGNIRETYVQSMSVLAAPFLFLMSEPEALASFEILLQHCIPNYVRKYVGVHQGCDLFNRCLHQLDPPLYERLKSHDLKPQVYAFPNISTLGMCVLPLTDSMRLMDIQLAYGCHLGVLFSLGRLLLARDKILKTDKQRLPLTTRDMETGLGFRSEEVLQATLSFILSIDEPLYREVVAHTGERMGGSQIERDTLRQTSSDIRKYLQDTAHSHLLRSHHNDYHH